ncbi:hypothetical protein CRG98_006085 [Punica granatum]|uniref:Uncharacterized protein n=1 Tax=Punica granatum TaxID=22663 RepID=A0A2I0KYF7_PUNGR|nr:hypothetical protein CRG98_006085 [Punica granatum]
MTRVDNNNVELGSGGAPTINVPVHRAYAVVSHANTFGLHAPGAALHYRNISHLLLHLSPPLYISLSLSLSIPNRCPTLVGAISSVSPDVKQLANPKTFSTSQIHQPLSLFLWLPHGRGNRDMEGL